MAKATALFPNLLAVLTLCRGNSRRLKRRWRTFWKVKFDLSMENRVAHCIEAVTIEKGYVLLFNFTSLDASKLDDLVGTLLSVRFTAAQ